MACCSSPVPEEALSTACEFEIEELGSEVPVEILELVTDEGRQCVNGSSITESKDVTCSSAARLWHGGVRLVIEAPLSRVWQISSQRCGLPLWMPMIESCEKLDGEDNTPGSTRRIRGDILPRIDGIQSWAIEKLVEFDEENHYYSYAVVESNIGMEGYRATFQLNDYGQETTLVSWLYQVAEMADSCEEVMADYMAMFFKACIRRLETLASEQHEASIENQQNQPASFLDPCVNSEHGTHRCPFEDLPEEQSRSSGTV